jgi:Mg2+ and Co2+ transporter CorA
MASTLERLASELAEETFQLMQLPGEERLFMEVAKVLGAASQTLEEAFLTEVRVRMAHQKAKQFLTAK